MKLWGIVVEKEINVITQAAKAAAEKFELAKAHEAEVAKLKQELELKASMHKAEEQRANLMMALLAAGMIQRRLIVHGRGSKKQDSIALPSSIIDAVAKRTDWALDVSKDPATSQVHVTIVPRPVKAVDADKKEEPSENQG